MTRGGRSRRQAPKTRGLGGEQIEGRHAVIELLVAGKRRVHEVKVMRTESNSAFIEEMFDLGAGAGAKVSVVERQKLLDEAQSEAPQGVIAFADPLEEVTLDRLLQPSNGATPFLLALDGITDPHNLGALIRTAECAGVTGVIIPGHRSVNVTATAAKAAAGALEHVSIATVAGIPSAMQAASKVGVWNVGLDPDGRETVWDFAVATAPMMLILGAEGAGLARLTKDRCDSLVSIPQYGTVASLNVSNAGAVACFAVAHKRSLATD